jgi:hypothetical protein
VLHQHPLATTPEPFPNHAEFFFHTHSSAVQPPQTKRRKLKIAGCLKEAGKTTWLFICNNVLLRGMNHFVSFCDFFCTTLLVKILYIPFQTRFHCFKRHVTSLTCTVIVV